MMQRPHALIYSATLSFRLKYLLEETILFPERNNGSECMQYESISSVPRTSQNLTVTVKMSLDQILSLSSKATYI